MEQKLSEQIKHCLDRKGCDKCDFFEAKSVLACRSLLQKVYDEIKRYEDMFPCKVGDKVYADSGVFGILEYNVDCIIIDENITYHCSAHSSPIWDCPSECLDEIEPDILDFGKTIFLTKEEAVAALKKESEQT